MAIECCWPWRAGLLIFDLPAFALRKETLRRLNGFLDANEIVDYLLAFAGRPRLVGTAALAFRRGAALLRI